MKEDSQLKRVGLLEQKTKKQKFQEHCVITGVDVRFRSVLSEDSTGRFAQSR